MQAYYPAWGRDVWAAGHLEKLSCGPTDRLGSLTARGLLRPSTTCGAATAASSEDLKYFGAEAFVRWGLWFFYHVLHRAPRGRGPSRRSIGAIILATTVEMIRQWIFASGPEKLRVVGEGQLWIASRWREPGKPAAIPGPQPSPASPGLPVCRLRWNDQRNQLDLCIPAYVAICTL